MRTREPTKGNAQLIRQNDYSFTKIELMYCLTRKALKCNSLVQKICFVSSKRDITLQKQFGIGSPGTKAVYFWRPLLLKECQEAQIPCIPSISC